jgi:hypothetical protein
VIMEKGFKSGKQCLNDAGLGQIFTKPPYGFVQSGILLAA